MSIPKLQSYPYEEVAQLLPERFNNRVITNVRSAERNLGHLNINGGKKRSNWFPIIGAIGMIVALGGVFLTLAAYQILPHGINAISRLDVWGRVAGYGTIGCGVLVFAIGAVKSLLIRQQNTKIDAYQSGIEGTRHNSQSSEMDAYFPVTLKDNELFAMNNSSRKEITVYSHTSSKTFSYEENPNDAYTQWVKKKSDIVKGKSFITLETLKQKSEEFERRIHFGTRQ